MDLKNLSSNWKKLQTNLGTGSRKSADAKPSVQDHGLKRKRPISSTISSTTKRTKYERPSITTKRSSLNRRMSHSGNEAVSEAKKFIETKSASNDHISGKHDGTHVGDRINVGMSQDVDIGRYVALDCEMVGVGPEPSRESALARVSLVNYNGEQVYDSYVKPQETVTDWRTHVSGITPDHMKVARTLKEVQQAVGTIMKDRIVVGHSVRGDFRALLLDHPKRDIRDTARHAPYRKLAGGGSPKLKILVSELLGLEIQTSAHSSIEDARATMLLFRRDKEAFEREHAKKWPTRAVTMPESGKDNEDEKIKKRPKKKKKKKR